MDLRRLLGLVTHHGGGQPIVDTAPMKQLKQPLQPHPMLPELGQYAQYMNPDGTGGGFGPTNPSHLRDLLNVSGGNPQGFPGAETFYTSPNMQQPMPVQPQGPEDPGYTPLQGSINVPNPQSSNKRRTPTISF